MNYPAKLWDFFSGRYFARHWSAIDADAARERAEREAAGAGYDWRPLVALIGGAAFLTIIEWLGGPGVLHQWMRSDYAPSWGEALRGSRWWALALQGWWTLWRTLGYLIFPLILLKLTKQRIRDQHLGPGGSEDTWLYLTGFGVVITLVAVVSYGPHFSNYYPFYNVARPPHVAGASSSWVDFLSWEMMYALQFFSLEFFFRGWWLKSCRAAMGHNAIFVMVVPYVMIHFGKPTAEVFGAIVAGLFLGTLAMKTKSIWGGFLTHVGVAISMDVAALLQTHGLPTVFWPPS